ncbi:dienelactone hydrolase family protein [Alteromonas lipolytica]|uniref:Dienelactone hydrolase domain-containing protein n=1 Tax=Alteromonas lipolytica TaxID=1856405 RepID=A0A1E8FJV6_9ALTE|nr:dienelactone hydrolase family protein [Alteromonas lipolytica]OFI36205.1 hypothetical protein BFC17_08765 [Alteromonas lipolytica]GGF78764.1 carboxymethylenebutenolidase [Alteromonas lipolytica]
MSDKYQTTTLNAADGHTFNLSVLSTQQPSKGAVVVLQEVFGITNNIYAVGEEFAAAGFTVVIPHLFDRIQTQLVVPYTDVKQGVDYVTSLDPQQTLMDISAAVEYAKQFGAVATVGYCWGGSLAFRSAVEFPVKASIAYYGGQIANMCEQQPEAPVQYHFGKLDKFIPAEDVAKIRAAQPDGEIYEYDADHGFSCNERASFDAEAHQLAFSRSVAFLSEHL